MITMCLIGEPLCGGLVGGGGGGRTGVLEPPPPPEQPAKDIAMSEVAIINLGRMIACLIYCSFLDDST
jgi:hypothetical protein